MWAASSTLAESTALTQPGGQKGPGQQGCEGLAGENAALQLGKADPSPTVLVTAIS